MSTRRIRMNFGDIAMVVDLMSDRDRLTARVGDNDVTLSIQPLSGGAYVVTSAGHASIVYYAVDGRTHLLHIDGQVYRFQRGRPETDRPGAVNAHSQDLGAPMPGIVSQVFVQEGQIVTAGDPLFVVEAMKMEHVVRAVRASRVAKVRAALGAQVDGGAIVVEVENVTEPSS